jgi:hypothetical protein
MPPRARPKGPLTWEELRSQLHYNKRTGWLTWKIAKPRIRIGQRAGSVQVNGTRVITICGQNWLEHRLIWFWVIGQDPGDLYVDHKNRVRDDNRWCNLRLATHGQNYVNSMTFGNMRGIMRRSDRCWRVRSIVGGRRKSFHVKTLSAAKRLRRKLEVQEWGGFACRRK